ncbi:DUF4058 family protein [Leptolyngbya sp. PCC 6406]|uniref:DUF4058 family protein n=1 Tax=Leptolyngbya sp. PCC 6406 TaxID=1173264 RepID=UPI0012DD72E5|nr:DUF4058 family protein [Leptolyngbya sp. PCC 6406]
MPYEFDLTDPIPTFAVPLEPGDPEPRVTLQQRLNEGYTCTRTEINVTLPSSLPPPVRDLNL